MSDDDYRKKYGLDTKSFKQSSRTEKSLLVKQLYVDENLSKHHVATVLNYKNGSYRLFKNYGNFLTKNEDAIKLEVGRRRSGWSRRIDTENLVSKEVRGKTYFSDDKGWFIRSGNSIRRYTERSCEVCKESFMSIGNRSRLCSTKCTNINNSGSNNHNHKGESTHDHQGYVIKHVDGRRVREHRKILEDLLGRRLSPKEVVHHINNRKTDNRLNNLVLVSHQQHIEIHRSYDKCLFELMESGVLSFNRETLTYEVNK